MIEGVNASIVSASLVRPAVDQVERVASYAANPSQVQRIAQPPYLSLYIAMNYTIDKAVLQIRDAESAEVLSQIPSDAQIKAYRKAAVQQPAIFEAKADAIEGRQAEIDPVVAAEAEVSVSTSTSSDTDQGTGSADAQTTASVLITA
jgi:hypothetical protein